MAATLPDGLIAPPPLACDAGHCGRLYGTADGTPADVLGNALSVRLNTPLSAPLLDFQNRQTDKQLLILGSIPAVVQRPVIVPAAQMRLSGLIGRTNVANKFGYLGRFPPDFVGPLIGPEPPPGVPGTVPFPDRRPREPNRTASDLRILQANLAATAYFTPWAAGYVETLFSDVFTFTRDPRQGTFQVRQAYATFGNLREFPLYGFIGKKNVSFGDFSTLSPFTQAAPWHYFAALGEGAGVGYVRGGLHLVATGLAGGRGVRVSDSEQNGRVNNFALNASYAGRAGAFEYLVGAGYLDGTIYNAGVPEHEDRELFGPPTGAWDVNGTLRWRRLTLAAEYVRTSLPWPVTDHDVIRLPDRSGVRPVRPRPPAAALHQLERRHPGPVRAGVRPQRPTRAGRRLATQPERPAERRIRPQHRLRPADRSDAARRQRPRYATGFAGAGRLAGPVTRLLERGGGHRAVPSEIRRRPR